MFHVGTEDNGNCTHCRAGIEVAGCKCQIVHPRFDRRSAATSGLLGDGDPLLVDGPFRPPRHGSAYE